MTTNISVGVMLESLDHALAWADAAGATPPTGDPLDVKFDPSYWPGFLDKTDELYDIPALSSLL